MFIAIRKRLEDREEGFTLIELLVVVIIIGILAAIAIPTFLRQRERGWEAAIQSDLRNAVVAQESWATANNGNYTATKANLVDEGFNETAGVTVAIVTPAAEPAAGAIAQNYCMTGANAAGGDDFYVRTNGTTPGEITRFTTGTPCT